MKYISFIFILLLLTSCGKTLVFEIPEKPQKQVINAFAVADSQLTVYLSTSKSIGSTQQIRHIANAGISLYENDQFQELLQLDHFIENYSDTIYFYRSDKKLIPDKEYKIVSEVDTFTTATAMTTIPDQVPYFNLKIETLESEIFDVDTVYTATISFEILDPSSQENFYHLILYQDIDRKLFYETADNSAVIASNGSYIFRDSNFNGKIKKFLFTVNVPSFNNAYELNIELRLTSDTYFLYQQSLSLQSANASNPFGQPVNIFTNVEMGYGIFASFNSYTEKIKIK